MLGEIILTALKIVLVALEGQPPEVRAELWRRYIEDSGELRAFIERVKDKLHD